MKNTYIKLLALMFVASASVSCVNDDETFGVNANKSKATTTMSALTLVEGETGLIPFTIANPINKVSQFKIQVGSGSATQSDFSAGDALTDADTGTPGVGFEITVPAFSSSFDIPVNAILDILPEATETVELKISAAGVRTILADATVELTITNFSSQDLGFLLEWDKNVTYSFEEEVTEEDGDDTDFIISEETENLCNVVDFDLILNPGTVYLAGTGDCPEVDYAFGVLADGSYDIVVDLYSVTTQEVPLDAFNIPFKLTIGKTGTFIATVEYEDLFNSSSPDSSPNGAGAGMQIAATLEVAGGLYTVYDKEGNLVAAE